MVYAAIKADQSYSNVVSQTFSTDRTPETPSPTLELIAGTPGQTTYSFTIRSTEAEQYAYLLTRQQDAPTQTPSAEHIFSEGRTGATEGSVEIQLTELLPNTAYRVYAAVKTDERYSVPASLEFTTGEQTEPTPGKLITLVNKTQSSYTFRVDAGEGNVFRITTVAKGLFDMGGYDERTYLSTFGMYGEGDQTYEWINGNYLEGILMEVSGGMEYIIFAGLWDENAYDFIGEVERLDLTTPEWEVAEGTVEVTVSEVTGSTAKITFVPTADIESYRAYVLTQQLVDEAYSGVYGDGYDFIIYLTESEFSNAALYEGKAEEVWGNLQPGTDYCVSTVANGANGSKKLILTEFRTL